MLKIEHCLLDPLHAYFVSVTNNQISLCYVSPTSLYISLRIFFRSEAVYENSGDARAPVQRNKGPNLYFKVY